MIFLLFVVVNILIADKNKLEVRKRIGSNATTDIGQMENDGDILILWSLETPRIIHFDG